jgi:hypothetical protein
MRLICTSNSASGIDLDAQPVLDQIWASRTLLARFTAANFSWKLGSSANACRAWQSRSMSSRNSVADPLADQLGQARIALHQPAARRDAVGLVVDAVRDRAVQVGEHRLLHQVGVQRRDAVDRVRADEGELPMRTRRSPCSSISDTLAICWSLKPVACALRRSTSALIA